MRSRRLIPLRWQALMPTIEEKTNMMQKLQLMAAAEFAFKSPLIRRSYEKIRSWFESPTTNGMAIWKFEYLPVRPEALEGRSTIFSQLPFFKGGIFSL